MTKTILYLTDKLGVTEGYKPMFAHVLRAVKIPLTSIQFASIHAIIPDALVKRGNEIEQVLNKDVYESTKKYIDHLMQVNKPDLIVTSCSATLGVLNGMTAGADKISLTRGSVYAYNGVPALIVPPLSAIHRQQHGSNVDDIGEDGLESGADVYRIKDGHWFLARDWSKVARYYHDKQRRFPAFRYSVARSLLDLPVIESYLRDCVLIATDVETTGSHEAGGYCISCIGYTGLHKDGHIHTYVIPFADKFKYSGLHWENDYAMASAWLAVQRINALDAIKVMQNGSYDCAYFATYGIPPANYLLDTMHMWHSLYPELPKSLDVIASIFIDDYAYWKQDLKGVKEEKGGRRDRSMERFWRYNALDCYYTLCSALQLLRLVNGDEKIKLNYANEFMQMLAGLTMTLRGIKADFGRREELRAQLQNDYNTSVERFKRLIADPDFNINSPQQKNELFYDILGAQPRNAKGKLIRGKNKKIGRSSGKYALKMIKSEHPFLRIVADALDASQEPLKQISNVCNMTVATHRVRSSISVRTETWRYSSSESPFWDGSNLQNIRKSMRDWMVADEGCILFDVDYSQSDAVFVAYESNDAKYINTVSSGKDTHAIHAEFFFKMPYEEIIAGKEADDSKITHPITGIRNITKRIVHGANFQMAGGTLYVSQMGKEATIATARFLGFPNPETWTEDQLSAFCQRLLNMYRGLYPRLSKNGWYGEIAQRLETTRQITNAFGMTRTFIGSPKDPATQREATAFYGQSDTAGNMNRSLEELMYGYIPPTFRDGVNESARAKPLQIDNPEYGMKMLLQVHDSFIGQISTRAPRWKEALHNVLTVMERPVTINGHRVVVKTEAEIGQRWGKGMIPWRPGNPYDLDRLNITTR